MKHLKKIMAAILSLSITIVPVTASASTWSDNYFIQGDINGDGTVNSSDFVSMKQFLNGHQDTDNRLQQQRLDVDKNGLINNDDLQYLHDILSGGKKTGEVKYNSNFGLPESKPIVYAVFDVKTGKKVDLYMIYNRPNLPDSSSFQKPNKPSENTKKANIGNTDISSLSSVGAFNNGTAFAIDNHTFLTAAHTVWTKENIKNNKTIELRNSSNKNKSVTVKYIHIPTSYLNGEGSTYDYAMVTVEEDLTQYIRKEDFFDIGLVSNDSVNYGSSSSKFTIHMAGYMLGDELRHTKGELVRNYEDSFHYSVTSEYGASGGPVYTTVNNNLVALGINTSKINEGGRGIRFNAQTLHWIKNNPSPYR